MGLSFRVRNGTGRFPHAMTTVTRSPGPVSFCAGGWVACWVFLLWNNSILLYKTFSTVFDQANWSRDTVRGVLFFWFQLYKPFGFVGWEPHSEREHLFYKNVCCVSYRPISTGQLHESLVLASTSGLSTQWSGWGPLTHKVYGNLISKRASRLDAFSGYPIRT